MALGHLLHGPPQPDAPGAIGRAHAYELLMALVFAGRRRRFFSRIVKLSGATAGDAVLDVGCGPGYLTALAAEAVAPGGHADGIDPSEPMIRHARRRRGGNGRSFRPGRAEALDAADATYDIVLSTFVVHHLPAEVRATAFAEMYRVLRPGGRVLVADFQPPRGKLGRHIVGALAGKGMRDNPVEQIAPMIRDTGFHQISTGNSGSLLHYVLAGKPTSDEPA